MQHTMLPIHMSRPATSFTATAELKHNSSAEVMLSRSTHDRLGACATGMQLTTKVRNKVIEAYQDMIS